VIFDSIHANGLESPQADVQGDLGGFDATLADAVEDCRSEVKAGSGSCDRPVLLGIDSLVALEIARRIGARDIGRKRDVADAVENRKEIVVAVIFSGEGLETDAAFAEFGAGKNFGLQFVVLAEEKVFANTDLASGADQALPIVGLSGKLARQQNLDAALQEVARRRIMRADRLSLCAFAAAVKPRRKDASVVKNNEIAGAQQIRKITELAITVASAISLKVQHSGAISRCERFLGDEFFGKMKVEVRDQHRARL
jgi:hypothetical protein